VSLSRKMQRQHDRAVVAGGVGKRLAELEKNIALLVHDVGAFTASANTALSEMAETVATLGRAVQRIRAKVGDPGDEVRTEGQVILPGGVKSGGLLVPLGSKPKEEKK